MGEPNKIRYEVDLSAYVSKFGTNDGGVIRPLTRDDREGLAHLMLDAYRGTIDSADETLEDAFDEVDAWYDRSPLLEHSCAIRVDDRLVSAVMVSDIEGSALVGYVMTAADRKSRGLGRQVVDRAFVGLRAAGHTRAVLFITEGNTPSERLFASLGAVATPRTASVARGAAERRESGSAYQLRFRSGESVEAGAARILTALTNEMGGFLADPGSVGVDIAVHEIRRRAKQARALVRLVRGAIPGEYGALNSTYRDAGRLLAEARDARVVVEAFDELLGTSANDYPIRSVLVRRADAAEARLFESEANPAGALRKLLADAAAQVGDLEIADDVSSIVVGATATYRAGRKAFSSSNSGSTGVSFHTWRKRVKDQRHHIAYLWECDPVDVEVHDRLYDLSDTLGAAHDLVVLSEHVRGSATGSEAEVEAIISTAGVRRVEREEAALELGSSLYATKPAVFAASLAERWETWRLRS